MIKIERTTVTLINSLIPILPPDLIEQTARGNHFVSIVSLTRSTNQQRSVRMETSTPNRIYHSYHTQTITSIQHLFVHQHTTHIKHTHTSITTTHTQPIPITRYTHFKSLFIINTISLSPVDSHSHTPLRTTPFPYYEYHNSESFHCNAHSLTTIHHASTILHEYHDHQSYSSISSHPRSYNDYPTTTPHSSNYPFPTHHSHHY